MRMKIDARLLEHYKLAKQYRAFLDGVEQRDCFFADEETGVVGRYVVPSKENSFNHTEFVRGKVELRRVEARAVENQRNGKENQMEQMRLLAVTVTRRFKPEQYELARVGYEGYRAWTGGRSIVTGDPLPGFDALLPKVQDAWAAAGEAMEQRVLQGLGLPDSDTQQESTSTEHEGWDEDVETHTER